MEFLKISNRKTWLIGDIPKYHPATSRHTNLWRGYKEKCISGMWGEDRENLYRYMPPKLFFYVNFGSILHVDKKSKSRKVIRPYLRDLEWELAYMLLEAKGFSGWTLDDEYSSHKDLADYYSGTKIKEDLPEECISLDTNEPKKYISARQAIRQLYSKPVGYPIYSNPSRNTFTFGSRGGGKTYFYFVGDVLQEVLFDGQKYYNEDTRKNPGKAEVFIGSALASKSSQSCEKIREALNELATSHDLGAWGNISSEDFEPSPFYKEMTGSLGPNNNKNPFKHEYSKKINNQWVDGFGTKSAIYHGIYTTENSQAAVGGRYTEMVDEEVGLHENVVDSFQANEACITVDGFKYGSQHGIGTAGNMEKIVGAQKIFNNPEDYDVVSYLNDWEEAGGRIGFFLPAYYTNNDLKDENGNTVIEEALKYYTDRREKKRKSKDPKVFEGEMMNYPIYPSEMFIKQKGNLLPSAEIIEVLRRKEKNRELDLYTKGTLIFNSDSKTGVEFKPDVKNTLTPISHYPLSANESTEGSLVIYEFPIEIDGAVPSDAYYIGCDPFGNDNEDGPSFGYIPVLKGTKHSSKIGFNQLVAEYFGRPSGGRKVINELLEKLNMFYGNGPRRIFFENKVGNVKEYFEKRGKLWMLGTQPKTVLTNKDGSMASSDLYGYPVNSKENKKELASYTYDWLLSERGNDGDRIIRNLDLIPSRILLQQMAAFDLDGNFDAVMGFFACILGLEETTNQYKDRQDDSKTKDTLDFLNNNKFLFPNQKQPNNKLNLKNVYWNLS